MAIELRMQLQIQEKLATADDPGPCLRQVPVTAIREANCVKRLDSVRRADKAVRDARRVRWEVGVKGTENRESVTWVSNSLTISELQERLGKDNDLIIHPRSPVHYHIFSKSPVQSSVSSSITSASASEFAMVLVLTRRCLLGDRINGFDAMRNDPFAVRSTSHSSLRLGRSTQQPP